MKFTKVKAKANENGRFDLLAIAIEQVSEHQVELLLNSFFKRKGLYECFCKFSEEKGVKREKLAHGTAPKTITEYSAMFPELMKVEINGEYYESIEVDLCIYIQFLFFSDPKFQVYAAELLKFIFLKTEE